MSSRRTAPGRPLCSATRWPARPTASGTAAQLVVNPSESNEARNTAPTLRTPAKFSVLLGMSTTRWR